MIVDQQDYFELQINSDSTTLFNRIANIAFYKVPKNSTDYSIINERTNADFYYKCPPFAMELEIQYGRNTKNKLESWVAVVKLTNPSKDLLAFISQKNIGVSVNAGYGYIAYKKVDIGDKTKTFALTPASIDNAVIGIVQHIEVKRNNADTIVDIYLTDNLKNYLTGYCNISVIGLGSVDHYIKTICDDIKINTSNIDTGDLGRNTKLKSYTVHRIDYALQDLCRRCNCSIHLDQGILVIQPNTPKAKGTVLKLGPTTGLASMVQSIYDKDFAKLGNKLIKFKTLYFSELKKGVTIDIEETDYAGTYNIIKGTKRFSTYSDAVSEWEAIKA
jgi:hypothetical protein